MAQQETFERDYVLLREQYDPTDHERQFNDVRESAIQQGWHPTGPVEFKEASAHGAVSVRLSYSVPVVLASEAETYIEDHPRVPLENHEALEQAVEGDKHIDEADAELAEKQAKAVLERLTSEDEEPVPPQLDVPEGSTANTGPSEPATEEQSKPAPRKVDYDESAELSKPSNVQPESDKPAPKKRAAKKTAAAQQAAPSTNTQEGDA
jgi:hypothetical protein